MSIAHQSTSVITDPKAGVFSFNQDAGNRDRVLILERVAGHCARWNLPPQPDPADPIVTRNRFDPVTDDFCWPDPGGVRITASPHATITTPYSCP